MRDAVEMFGLRVLAMLAALLPAGVALAGGRALGRLAFASGVRTRVCLENLERAFPGAERAAERARCARQAYEHLGMLAVEFLRLPRLRPQGRRDLLEIHGIEHLHAALGAGRGAVVATAHYGNWEVLAAGAAAHGLPVTVVVQRLRNRRVDRFVLAVRTAMGERCIDRGMNLRQVRSELAANRLVAFLCDQDARRAGVFVPFFGIPASTPKGAVQMALRLGVPVIPLFSQRLPDGRHRMVVHPPLEVRRDLAEDEAVRQTLWQFHGLLEAAIAAAPGQYLWLHRRWKTAPPST